MDIFFIFPKSTSSENSKILKGKVQPEDMAVQNHAASVTGQTDLKCKWIREDMKE